MGGRDQACHACPARLVSGPLHVLPTQGCGTHGRVQVVLLQEQLQIGRLVESRVRRDAAQALFQSVLADGEELGLEAAWPDVAERAVRGRDLARV